MSKKHPYGKLKKIDKTKETEVTLRPFKIRPYQKEVLDFVDKNKDAIPITGWRHSRYPKPFIGIDIGAGDDKSVAVSGIPDGNGGFKVITIDEWSTWTEYKWYRNPIKWYKLRRLMKRVSKNSHVEFQSTPPRKK